MQVDTVWSSRSNETTIWSPRSAADGGGRADAAVGVGVLDDADALVAVVDEHDGVDVVVVGGVANEADVLPTSPVSANVIAAGSGGGIGIDGVTQPPTPSTRPRLRARMESERRMDPGPGSSKPWSRSGYRISSSYENGLPISLAGRQLGSAGRRRLAVRFTVRPLHRRREHDRDARTEEQVVQEAVVVVGDRDGSALKSAPDGLSENA